MSGDVAHPEPETAELTLEGLWSHLFGTGQGWLVTFTGRQSTRPEAKPNTLDNTEQKSWAYPGEAAEAAEYLAAQSADGRDAYFGVHLFTTADSRTKENAAPEVAALWVDGDGAQIPADWPEPTARIESSPGREHYYWRLTRPIPAEKAANLNRRLTYGMGADKGKWGLGTVLRAPGTKNYKRDAPTEVQGWLTGVEPHDPADIDATIPSAEEVVPAAKAARKGRRGSEAPRIQAAAGEPPVKLSRADMEAWEGTRSVTADKGGVDRSGTLLWIACGVARGLRRAGVAESEHARIIEDAVEERDSSLGYQKYTGRDDRAKRYAEMARKALAEAEREPARNGSGSGGSGSRSSGASTPAAPTVLHRTDAHNAKRLAALHGEHICYIDPWRKFFVYDGIRWRTDDLRQVERWATEDVPDRILDEAKTLPAGSDERSDHLSWSGKSESNMRIKATVERLKSEADIATTYEHLDQDPWSLNTRGGTVDLQSGQLRGHDPEDYITKLAPVDYDPASECPKWEAMLEHILPDPEVRRYVQKACGYSATALSGQSGDQILLVPYGMGANGKSTMLGTIADVLGGYAQLTAPDLLVQKRSEHPTALADLFGVRMLLSIETEENIRLNESLIKRLTGGERVRARRMKEDFWEFEPTHTIWFAVNHKPEIRGTDHAIWRRVKLIPFTVQIPEAEQNKQLREELKEEWPGIARWIVDGCRLWLSEGLEEPEAVRVATAEHRRGQDVIGRFFEECCVLHPEAEVGAAALFKRYEEWCEEQRETPKTQHKFGAALRDRGEGLDNSARFTSGPNKGKTKWTGIGLTSPEDDPEGGPSWGHRSGEPLASGASPSEAEGEPLEGESSRAQAYKAENRPDGEPLKVHSGPKVHRKVHRENSVEECGNSGSTEGRGEPSEPFGGLNASNSPREGSKGHEGSLGSLEGESGSAAADIGGQRETREAEIEAALEEHDRVCRSEGFVPPEGREEFVKENWPPLSGNCMHDWGGCWMCRKRAWENGAG